MCGLLLIVLAQCESRRGFEDLAEEFTDKDNGVGSDRGNAVLDDNPAGSSLDVEYCSSPLVVEMWRAFAFHTHSQVKTRAAAAGATGLVSTPRLIHAALGPECLPLSGQSTSRGSLRAHHHLLALSQPIKSAGTTARLAALRRPLACTRTNRPHTPVRETGTAALAGPLLMRPTHGVGDGGGEDEDRDEDEGYDGRAAAGVDGADRGIIYASSGPQHTS
ncbi:hypothetical protein V8E53_004860 [Lactarius tabidus]